MEFNDTNGTVMDYKEYSLDIIKAAKNDTEAVTENVTAAGEDSTETSLQPKSRRKNAKFLEVSQQVKDDVNTGRKKRAPLEEDNPVDSDTSTTVSMKPAVTTAVPNTQFPTLQAVPVTSTEAAAVRGNVVDNSTSSNSSVTDENITTNNTVVETTTALTNISADGVNNGTQAVGVGTTTTSSTANDSNTITTVSPIQTDYPTYLSTQWTLLYNAKSSFNVPDLSPASMFSALQEMVKEGPESKIFVEYYEHNTGSHIVEKCNEACWREQLCTVSNLVTEELHTCLNSTGKDGFFEVSKFASLAPIPDDTTQKTGLFGGGGEKDPDHVVHGDNDQDDHDHDHDGDGEEDHDHEDHADNFPVVPDDEEDVTKEKVEDVSSNITSRAVAIFFGVLAVAIVALASLMGYKKYRDNRYRNQEFLLTDAVFRYDGYSQLDDA